MGNIKLEKLKVGMVLSQNVKDRNGRVLVAAGQKVTEKHLTIFKSWGVTDIVVESPAGNDEASASIGSSDPASIEKAVQGLKGLFRHADLRHPAVRELFNICVARKLRAQEQDKG